MAEGDKELGGIVGLEVVGCPVEWAEDGSFNVVLIELEGIEGKDCVADGLGYAICLIGVNWGFCG